MKKKKIETHKIGLVGQAPSRRGDPRATRKSPSRDIGGQGRKSEDVF